MYRLGSSRCSKPRAESVVETFGGAAAGRGSASESFRPETRRAVSGACLCQGQASKYEAEKEARTSRLQGHLPQGSRVTRSRLQAINVASAQRPPRAGFLEGGKHPGCRDGTPLRGGSRDGDLGRCVMRKGLHPSEPMLPDDHGVLDWQRRRGTSQPPSRLVREGDGVPSLRANRPKLVHRHCLTHPRRNRRWTRGAASHAASRGAVAFGAPRPGRLVPAQETVSMVRVWLAARLFSEERGLSHAGRVERGAREAGANASARAHPSWGPSRRSERGSDARGRARASLMLLQKSTDSGRRRKADAPPSHPIWKRSGTGA
jgi:hypothetical protein